MTDRALIVVDIQNDYFPGGRWPLVGVEAAADNAAAVLAAARAAGDLVVFIRHEFPDAETAPFFAPGSEGAAIHPKVANRAGEPVVVKQEVNAFKGTDLKAILDAKGIAKVTVLGSMSHMCVDAATRAASDFGYAVTLIHDACATRDLAFGGVDVPAASVHAAFMEALGSYATVISAAEYLSPARAA